MRTALLHALEQPGEAGGAAELRKMFTGLKDIMNGLQGLTFDGDNKENEEDAEDGTEAHP